MGLRGPAAKPTALKLLDGSYAAYRDAGGVEAPNVAPVCPQWLSSEAREVWDSMIDRLLEIPGLLARLDGESLARYCHDWCDFHAARQLVEREGMVATSEKGAVYQHPAVGIRNKAHDRLTKFEARFGMTPSDRARLHVQGDTPDDLVEKYLA